jgi:hypothetical protein
MGGRSSASSKIDWLVFSQYWSRAVKSDASARNRFTTPRKFHSAKHHPLDQIDHDRGPAGQSPNARPFQTDQFKAIFERLPRVYFPFHKDRPCRTRSAGNRWSHTGGSDLRCRGNTWFVPYETIQSRAKERPHPATFPVQLADWCIKLHGASRVQTMLDPFLGIGNSAVAAQRCDVKKFIGFEIDETYLAEAKRRVKKKS